VVTSCQEFANDLDQWGLPGAGRNAAPFGMATAAWTMAPVMNKGFSLKPVIDLFACCFQAVPMPVTEIFHSSI